VSQCGAACCSMLQLCCSVLQCVAVCCSVLQSFKTTTVNPKSMKKVLTIRSFEFNLYQKMFENSVNTQIAPKE